MSILPVEIENVYSDDVFKLLTQLWRELAKRYEEDADDGKGACESSDIDMPSAAFVVACLDGQPIACGIICRFVELDVAEVKRMLVAPAVRGRGISK